MIVVVPDVGGCTENGRTYQLYQQWERPHLGGTLLCTCGRSGDVTCETKPAGRSHDGPVNVYKSTGLVI